MIRKAPALALVSLALFAGPAHALSLAEAMAAAASNTEAATLLELAVDDAEASERTALGGLTPTLTASASSVRNSQAVELGGSSFVQLWDHEATLRASLDLFRGTAIPTWAAGRAQTDAARERAVWEAAGLRLAAARAYFGALTAAENLDAARSAVDLRTASLDQTSVLADAGFAMGADLSRAEYSLLEAETAALDARQTLDDRLDELAFLIGADAVDAADLQPPELPDFDRTPTTADLAALGADVQAQERLLRAQRMAFLPVLSVAGQYTIGQETLRAPDGTSWFLSFTATWDLFDYARYGRLDRARTGEAEAQTQLALAERERSTELATAERRVETARQRLVLAERSVTLAQETRRLESERFDGGDLTVLDLISADDELFRSQVRRNTAALELALARVELAYLSGALEDDSWLDR